MATFTAGFSSTTQTSSEFNASVLGGTAGYVNKRYVQLTINGSSTVIVGTNTSDGSGTYFSYTVTGLSPSTSYFWTAVLGYDGDSGIVWTGYTDSGTLTTSAPTIPLPAQWSWTASESSAFLNNGSITNLTMSRWNAFITRINDAIDYGRSVKGFSLSNISSSSVMSSDKILYAASFTDVAKCLNTLCWRNNVSDTGISSVSSGGTIYGHYFTDMSNALNRAINAMS